MRFSTNCPVVSIAVAGAGSDKQAQEKEDEWKAKNLEGWQACVRGKYKERNAA